MSEENNTTDTPAPSVTATASAPTTSFARFEKPIVQFNETGWGPCELSDTFKDMPYQPFSKSDRLGKICDWTNTSGMDKKFQRNLAIFHSIFTIFAYLILPLNSLQINIFLRLEPEVSMLTIMKRMKAPSIWWIIHANKNRRVDVSGRIYAMPGKLEYKAYDSN